MRVLILSDVHANLTALEAVLAATEGVYDELWNLGDTVGYGPHPNECFERLNAIATIQLAGNHDLASIGAVSTADFNPIAKEAALWTGRHLSEAAKTELAERLPLRELDGITLAHGSPRDPIWEYVLDSVSATKNMLHVPGDLCFVGHTHVAMFAAIRPGAVSAALYPLVDGETIDLQNARLLINPGSVGQPRDGDPRAAYALLDTEAQTVSGHRVSYDIARTQQAIRDAGLPDRLATRLASGR
jgi:diadenosine tetraphosphatase ApaH/serine/threonine PP2A family protein phosphatase